MTEWSNTLAGARRLDAEDVLKPFRNEFIIPKKGNEEQIYFLGNSLGLQPKRTLSYLQQVLEQWSHYGVEGFFTGDQPWLYYHDSLVNPLASIVGALPHELTVMNQLTVNLHLMLVSFYRPSGRRVKILCEKKAFPSDQYALETHVRQRGLHPAEVLVEVPASDGINISVEDILVAIDQHREELALVLWGGVNYYTGQVFDMERITEAGHQAGAFVGFDLAHAAGNVPLHLHRWNVDFACWCSYKYLNSGPGAIAGSFIHERFHREDLPRFAGWWGYNKEKRFLMQPGFDPAPSAEGWQLSTPSAPLYAAHKAALELFAEAGFERCVEKGKLLGDYLLFLLDELNKGFSEPPIRILTPRGEGAKGCQVSLMLPARGREVFNALADNGVFADWREPDVIRVAPVPLYNTFEEVWRFCRVLEEHIK